jgi:hypothetical protein
VQVFLTTLYIFSAPAGQFDYDVFVSYAQPNLPWVKHHLMAELEGRLGLRLCIHERDFLLGDPIVDNIVHSVQRSKKVKSKPDL